MAHEANVHVCTYEIALCASGQGGVRTNDIVLGGHYVVTGSDAVVTLDNDSRFHLDTDTGIATDAPLASWIPDTANRFQQLEWDVVTCD